MYLVRYAYKYTEDTDRREEDGTRITNLVQVTGSFKTKSVRKKALAKKLMKSRKGQLDPERIDDIKYDFHRI